jgi:hypothetical protein
LPCPEVLLYTLGTMNNRHYAQHVRLIHLVFLHTVLLITGCVGATSSPHLELDAGRGESVDVMIAPEFSEADQKLFDDRVLQIVCLDKPNCQPNRFELTVETDSELELSVQLIEAEQPRAATLVQFVFVDLMGIDIPGSVVDGVQLQVDSVATDARGQGSVRIMTGANETDVMIRASVPGVGAVEWAISVRREQVGTLEIETVYQPGSQTQGSAAGDSATVFLLADDGIESACEDFKSDPGTLTIHSVRQEVGSFEVSSDSFRSLVVFNSIDAGGLYISVGLVKDQDGTLIGYGCRSGVRIEAEETTRYNLVIDDVEIPLDYKGSYKVRLRLDLSNILDVDPESLNEADATRLARSQLYESFRQEIFQFSDGLDDRSRVLMRLFCDFVTFEGEECSQVESYIVRGLLGPLIDEVIAVEAPLFFDAMRLFGEALMLLRHIEIEAFINIRNKSPDTLGILRGNEIRWSRLGFGRGASCSFERNQDEGCQWAWFPIHELHLDVAGRFVSVRSQFDAKVDSASLTLLYHELRVHFGLLVTKLLERWIYPSTFELPVDSSLIEVIQAVLPCLPVDQFVGDEPFCAPFLILNIEYILREMLATYHFGGASLGFSGSINTIDSDGDRRIDSLEGGMLNIYLPDLVEEAAGNQPEENLEQSASAIQARRDARRTSLISTCFSACRCIADPCVCENTLCTP